MSVIKNARIFNGEVFTPLTAVRYEGGLIKELYTAYDGDDAIDAKGAILSPGFVDTHIHGSFGTDVLKPGGTDYIADHFPSVGTTSYCPTNATDTFEHINAFLGEVKKAMKRTNGTRVLGAHIEGPFFSIANRGAHATHMLKDPTIENYKEMVGEYDDAVLRVSLAPEKTGGMELITYLVNRGKYVSIAHTDSMAKDVEEAIGKGATISTHTFNGFFPMHHRQENGIAAVLTDDRIICEFIPDLQHINKYAARLILRSKGFEKTFICSDALEPGQMGDGIYQLAGSRVTVIDHVARLDDGRLAGSTICLLDGIRNLVNIIGIPLEKALKLATINPANSLGLTDIGSIKPGVKADFVLLSDDLVLQKTIIRGMEEYSI